LDRSWAKEQPETIHVFYGLIAKRLGLLFDNGHGIRGAISQKRHFSSYQKLLREGFAWVESYQDELQMAWNVFFSSQRERIPDDWYWY
jgi:hypothetical protein